VDFTEYREEDKVF